MQLPGIQELGLLFINVESVESLIEQTLNLAIERAFLIEPLSNNASNLLNNLQVGKLQLPLIAQEVACYAPNVL